MTEQNPPEFEMRAAIGRGLRWLDRNGSVVINDGRLALQKRGGRVIAEAPLGKVTARKTKGNLGLATTLHVDGRRYIVQPEGFISSGGAAVAMYRSVRSLLNLKKGKALTEQFLVALHEMGMPNGGDEANSDAQE